MLLIAASNIPPLPLGSRHGNVRHLIAPAAKTAFLIAEVANVSDETMLEVRLPCGAIARAAGSDQVRLLAELLRHLA